MVRHAAKHIANGFSLIRDYCGDVNKSLHIGMAGSSGSNYSVSVKRTPSCKKAAPHFVWKKRLEEGTPAKFLEVQVTEHGPSAPADSSVEIRLRNGRSLMVRPGFDAEHVRLFVFRSRRGDRLKILVWDRDGFVLWYKRLEVGVFKIPRVEQGMRSVELRASELAMILDGIDVSKLKRVPRYQQAIQSCG
jgi:transposase